MPSLLYRKIIRRTGGVIFAVIAAFMSYFTVASTERALVTTWGEITSEASEGLNFKIPLIQSTVVIPITNQVAVYDGVPVYSKDIQTASVKMSVTFRYVAGNLATLYRTYGEDAEARAINPNVNRVLEEVFGGYTAVDIVSRREQLGRDVFTRLAALVDPALIQIVSVQIQNVDFSDNYEKNVELVMEREAATRAAENDLRRKEFEAQQAVVEASAQAEATRLRADADAYARRAQGEAEAAAIAAKGQALSENPGLVALISAERWNGQLPSTMLPDGSVPFVTVPR